MMDVCVPDEVPRPFVDRSSLDLSGLLHALSGAIEFLDTTIRDRRKNDVERFQEVKQIGELGKIYGEILRLSDVQKEIDYLRAAVVKLRRENGWD